MNSNSVYFLKRINPEQPAEGAINPSREDPLYQFRFDWVSICYCRSYIMSSKRSVNASGCSHGITFVLPGTVTSRQFFIFIS